MRKERARRSLTDAQKIALLGKYPDGAAVGRVMIQRLIVDERKSQKNPQHRPTLTLEALSFLRGSLATEEDKKALDDYEALRGVIVRVTENLYSCTQAYYHGLFRALMALQLADDSLDVVYKIAPHVMGHGEGQEAVFQFVRSGHIHFETIRENLLPDWEELIMKSLHALLYNTCLLKAVADVKGLNLNSLLPPMKQHAGEMKELQQLARSVYNKLRTFVFGDRTSNRIEINPEVLRVLEEVWQYDLESLKWQIDLYDLAHFLSRITGMDEETLRPVLDKIVRKGF